MRSIIFGGKGRRTTHVAFVHESTKKKKKPNGSHRDMLMNFRRNGKKKGDGDIKGGIVC